MEAMDSSSISLNNEQRRALDGCINGERSVLVTGPGGTGKSVIVPMILSELRQRFSDDPASVVVTASTGSAAYLVGGVTLHRFAGIGIEENNVDLMERKARRYKKIYNKTRVLIIDEISMISGHLFNNLSKVAQRIRGNDAPFGGIKILMFGDFLQMPPVSKSDSDALVFETDAWKEMNPEVVLLKEDMRQSNPAFSRVLSKIRMGECDDNCAVHIRSLDRHIQYDDGVDPVMLYAKRAEADAHNNFKMAQLEGEEMSYTSIDHGYLTSLEQCPSPHVIKLKVGAQVMLNRNLSSIAVNGCIGTVTGFEMLPESKSNTRYPVVSMVLPGNEMMTMHMYPIEWKIETSYGEVVASRIQLPLMLSWAVTIHKSQGRTIPRVWIDMKGIFQQNQAYVALSRCTDPNNLQVVNFNRDYISADERSKNFYHILEEESDQENDATIVAPDTKDTESDQGSGWATNQADTMFMMGELTLRDTHQPSSQDLEGH